MIKVRVASELSASSLESAMVSLRRHTHYRLCAGRTPLPKFSDIRTASQYPNYKKPKSAHPTCSDQVINRPEGNRAATGTLAKSFTDAVLALPAFVTVGNEAGHSRIHKLRFQKNGNSLGADVSLNSQVSSLENQVNDPGGDASLSSQVKFMESQVKDPGDNVLSSQVEYLHLQSQVKDPRDHASLSSQVESLQSEVKDPGADLSLRSQVKFLENQVNDPGGDVSPSSQVKSLQGQVKSLQLENKIGSLQATVDKLKEEKMQQNADLDAADSEMLEFDKLLLEMIEKLWENVEVMQKADLLMGEPNQMQLRELLQKVEKLHEDLSTAARGASVEDSAAQKTEKTHKVDN